MTSTRPYLLRALYEWIIENNFTPHIVINAEANNVKAPKQFIKDGEIVLNISPVAVPDLVINNYTVEFTARFSGAPKKIYAPISAVMAIYARENGRGIVFEEDEGDDGGDGLPPDDLTPGSGPGSGSRKRGKPKLRIVK